MFKVPEKYRIIKGAFATDESDGNNGVFLVPLKFGRKAQVIASDGEGWQHVSVSLVKCKFTPSWEEMHFIKCLFWGEDTTVMQLHPPKSEYVNNHAFCLHLWRPVNQEIPLPDSILVGLKNLNL